ncbi:hypothetical protein CYMTET_53134 [Cymbomonas tetramitiformis]|uniref:Uncharacterized protein n=1 Tax=Cymbomonas tetramitiformis TaxID=36881 RepID=A0AAE0BHI9_9CHLO|nr:hypothetical protein CYMTET_53134 [Cymbomonas tetramitiformis]
MDASNEAMQQQYPEAEEDNLKSALNAKDNEIENLLQSFKNTKTTFKRRISEERAKTRNRMSCAVVRTTLDEAEGKGTQMQMDALEGDSEEAPRRTSQNCAQPRSQSVFTPSSSAQIPVSGGALRSSRETSQVSVALAEAAELRKKVWQLEAKSAKAEARTESMRVQAAALMEGSSNKGKDGMAEQLAVLEAETALLRDEAEAHQKVVQARKAELADRELQVEMLYLELEKARAALKEAREEQLAERSECDAKLACLAEELSIARIGMNRHRGTMAEAGVDEELKQTKKALQATEEQLHVHLSELEVQAAQVSYLKSELAKSMASLKDLQAAGSVRDEARQRLNQSSDAQNSMLSESEPKLAAAQVGHRRSEVGHWLASDGRSEVGRRLAREGG